MGLSSPHPRTVHEAVRWRRSGTAPESCARSHFAVGVAACQRIVDAEVAIGRRLLQLGLMRVYDPAHVQLAAEVAELGELHHIRCVHRNVHEVRRTAQLILNQSLVHDIHSPALARRSRRSFASRRWSRRTPSTSSTSW